MAKVAITDRLNPILKIENGEIRKTATIDSERDDKLSGSLSNSGAAEDIINILPALRTDFVNPHMPANKITDIKERPKRKYLFLKI